MMQVMLGIYDFWLRETKESQKQKATKRINLKLQPKCVCVQNFKYSTNSANRNPSRTKK